MSAGFTLEMGLGADSGAMNQGGRAFGRQSFVSLDGAWGSLGLGRQYTMLFWSMAQADVLGPNMFGLGSLDSYFPNARAVNALSYQGRFAGWTVGATYSFGRDAVNAGPSPSGTNCAGESAGGKSACREWSAMLKYDAEAWGVALAHDALRGGPGAFAGLSDSGRSDRRSMLNGYARLAGARLGAGYMRRDNGGDAAVPRSDLWFVGATYPTGPWVFDVQYSQLKYQGSPDRGQLLALRGSYKLSRRTAVHASLGYMRNSGNASFSVSNAQAGGLPAAGVNQAGLGVGLRHAF